MKSLGYGFMLEPKIISLHLGHTGKISVFFPETGHAAIDIQKLDHFADYCRVLAVISDTVWQLDFAELELHQNGCEIEQL